MKKQFITLVSLILVASTVFAQTKSVDYEKYLGEEKMGRQTCDPESEARIYTYEMIDAVSDEVKAEAKTKVKSQAEYDRYLMNHVNKFLAGQLQDVLENMKEHTEMNEEMMIDYAKSATCVATLIVKQAHKNNQTIDDARLKSRIAKVESQIEENLKTYPDLKDVNMQMWQNRGAIAMLIEGILY